MRSRLLTALSGLALLGLPVSVLAGGDDVPIGARFGAMGNAGITLVDLWSIRHNPAGLAGLESPRRRSSYLRGETVRGRAGRSRSDAQHDGGDFARRRRLPLARGR